LLTQVSIPRPFAYEVCESVSRIPPLPTVQNLHLIEILGSVGVTQLPLRGFPNLRSRSVVGTVRIGTDGRTFLPRRSLGRIPNQVLRDSKLRFGRPEKRCAVRITGETPAGEISSYHVYQGGMEFRPVLPKQRFSPGDSVRISIEILPIESFIGGLQHIEFANIQLSKWVSNQTLVKSVKLTGRKLQILFAQNHPLVDLRLFELGAKLERYPGISNQRGGVYLDCSFSDYVGRVFKLRIRHDGFSQPEFQVDRGAGFEKVTMISFDGIRLIFRYGKRALSTVYLKAPSRNQYVIGSPREYNGNYLNSVRDMFDQASILDSVKLSRRLEQVMLLNGSSYDQGRIGAEIAYMCGVSFLHLRNLVIEEPSKGGKDLYTSDRTVSIQARMLRETPGRRSRNFISAELLNLVRKLGQDFRHNPAMRFGYAILSLVNLKNEIKTLFLRVPNRKV